MTVSELVWGLQNQGAVLSVQGERLCITPPPGGLSTELCAAVADLGPAVVAFARAGWEIDAAARAQAQLPACCTACGCALKVLPWEDPRTAICLDCCRRQYLDALAVEERPRCKSARRGLLH